MHLAFTERLGLVIQNINVGVQKIDGTTLKTYEMVHLIPAIIKNTRLKQS